jgi:sugar lactone lactonase YvrE
MSASTALPGARYGLLASLLMLAVACKKDSDTGVDPNIALPKSLSFRQPGLYPEGTQYDSQSGRFLVSSQTAGRIGQIADDSTYTTFADNDSLISSIGLNLDAPRNRLLAAISDPGYNAARTNPATKGKLARLGIFNRNTGTKIQFVELSAKSTTYPAHFANDIAVDVQGNAYVTDSYAPLIYKVSFNASGRGAASVWLDNTALSAPAGKFGLNGIVFHPSGYLLVAKSDEGKLLKIPITSTTTAGVTTTTPGTISTVTLPAGLDLSGADGLQLLNNTTLLVVCNAQGKVYRLTTSTDFVSVATSGTFDARVGGTQLRSPYPTTLASRTASGPGASAATASYVLYSHLDSLQANKTPATKRFTLRKVVF